MRCNNSEHERLTALFSISLRLRSQAHIKTSPAPQKPQEPTGSHNIHSLWMHFDFGAPALNLAHE